MKVSIVGGGVSGLFCAYELAKNGISVSLYEKEKGIGKKLLVAGKSGLNITSNCPLNTFHEMYLENKDFFKDLIAEFSPTDTRSWLKNLGFETFVGSSHKVFPKEFKAASLLTKIKSDLLSFENFELITDHELVDFDGEYLYFKNEKVSYDKAIFALGGASWSSTGSDGAWIKMFESKGIAVKPFKQSNCGFKTSLKSEGRFPLKNISVRYKDTILKGESMIFDHGIEGGVIYHLSSYIREDLLKSGNVTIAIDFMPNLSLEKVVERISVSAKQSWKNTLRKNLRLSPEIMNLIKESLTKDEYFDPMVYSAKVKSFNITINGLFDLDSAISTAGGVCLSELNSNLSLNKFNDLYLCGEMLDWEAPTGGFLIQGCFSLANKINQDILIKKAGV